MARKTGLRMTASALALTMIAVTGCLEVDESGTGFSGDPIFSDRPLSGSGSSRVEVQELAISTDRYAVGPVELSPNISFRVGWRVEFGADPALELYLSPTTNRFNPDARTLYRCNERLGGGLCRQSVTCDYGNDNDLSCSASDGERTPLGSVDVAKFINQETYLILHLSSRDGSGFAIGGDTESLPIRLN